MDGKKVAGNILPPDSKPGKEHHVEVVMG